MVHPPKFDTGSWYEECTDTAKRLNRGVWETSVVTRLGDVGVAEIEFSDFTWMSDVPNFGLPTAVPAKKPSVTCRVFDQAERKRAVRAMRVH